MKSKVPSPAILGKKFSGAGLSYNKSALLASGKASSYSNRYSQSLGLGAYGADLGFACAYNQSQDALEYLNAIGKLAQDLGVASAFDKEFVAKILQSIGKSDSLQIMLDEANEKAERNMVSNQRGQSAVLMMCGGWVEGIYVATEHLKAKKDDPKSKAIYGEIYSHCTSLDYIKEMLKAYKGVADIDKFAADLEPFLGPIQAVNNHQGGFEASYFDTFYTNITGLRNKILN